jgi:hypothetical protein
MRMGEYETLDNETSIALSKRYKITAHVACERMPTREVAIHIRALHHAWGRVPTYTTGFCIFLPLKVCKYYSDTPLAILLPCHLLFGPDSLPMINEHFIILYLE